MIKISVASYNNTPNTQGLAFTFDELGGTIGRADTNQLILPDPERSISRVHAQVVFRNGRFSLIDKGSNPVSVNGKALGNGAEATIQAGDQVQIGGYLLLVESALGAVNTGATALAPSTPASPAVGGDPFAGFWSPAPVAASPFAAPAMAPAPSASGIPVDWDPFGSPAPAPASAPVATSGQGSTDPLGMFGQSSASQMAKASESSIDSLFGLGAPTGKDPFSQSPLGTGLGGPNTATDLDPLRALGLAKDPGLAAMSDQGSDLNTPFLAPAGTPAKALVAAPASTDPFANLGMAAPAPAPAPSPALSGGGGAMLLPDDFDFLSPSPAPSPAPAVSWAPAPAPVMAPPPAAAVLPPSPSGAVVSWGDTGSVEGRTLIKPKARPAAEAPAAAFGAPMAPPSASSPAPAPATQAALAATVVPTGSLPQGDDARALLQAFKEGLGTPTVQIDALTPEVMRLIGQLLHDSAQGTVDLLVARAALKREVRAEVTMIVAQKNNPLKFSPTVEVALGHLLSPPQRGFMPASQAMQDAYDDLRAHQFGFMAGMKAALDGVLKRFDPAQLEGKLTQKSMLQSLLPATRKARMWEVFQELYAQISAEASDDFHELFGKAFLKAYEAHIDELHNERDRHQR